MSYPPFNPQGIGTLNETARNMFRQQPLNMPYGPAQQLAYQQPQFGMGGMQQPQFGMGGMQQGNGINLYGQYLERTYGDPEFDQKRDTFLQDVQQKERQTFGGGGGSFGFPAMLSIISGNGVKIVSNAFCTSNSTSTFSSTFPSRTEH